jgi:hypothetical protein
MFNISPSKKETTTPNTAMNTLTTNPVIKWTTERNFIFPPALTNENRGLEYPRLKQIHESPKVGSSFYTLISQYNPWLDCEMTCEKRAFLTPRVGEFACAVNYSNNAVSTGDSRIVPNFFRNETVVDIVNLYLWPLLYSRSDDVVACRTFADWRRLFTQTISLAFPDYEYWVSVAASNSSVAIFIPVSDQRRTSRFIKYITPARVLYLLTTRANFWPYCASTRPSSSRTTFGLCSIKSKIKDYNDKTEIDWLVSADFLRKMKRVHVYFTMQQSEFVGSLNDSDSE